jgi:hypothetical protein
MRRRQTDRQTEKKKKDKQKKKERKSRTDSNRQFLAGDVVNDLIVRRLNARIAGGAGGEGCGAQKQRRVLGQGGERERILHVVDMRLLGLALGTDTRTHVVTFES